MKRENYNFVSEVDRRLIVTDNYGYRDSEITKTNGSYSGYSYLLRRFLSENEIREILSNITNHGS